jgi:4-phosphopantoate--beta-alanine ligase
MYELMNAENPVISVNGNVAALVPKNIVKLAERLDAKLEINLFHRTEERIKRITDKLKENGADHIYGSEPDEEIPGLDHARALCSYDGIYSADVVLVPLEDGDRAEALSDMGKTVITIDLNPMSRTSKTSDITIVDNLTRAVKNMLDLEPSKKDFNNKENLSAVLKYMSNRLDKLAEEG